jgi:drug/metabolite transporter (DMT)-like permease
MPIYQAVFKEPVQQPIPMDWLWLFVLSWVCTIFTFFLYIRSLKHISAFTMNLTLTLEPVYGIILAFLIYHENDHLSRWFYFGFTLIALSVFFHMWRLVKGRTATRVSVPE